jgi:hypothetical protein
MIVLLLAVFGLITEDIVEGEQIGGRRARRALADRPADHGADGAHAGPHQLGQHDSGDPAAPRRRAGRPTGSRLVAPPPRISRRHRRRRHADHHDHQDRDRSSASRIGCPRRRARVRIPLRPQHDRGSCLAGGGPGRGLDDPRHCAPRAHRHGRGRRRRADRGVAGLSGGPCPHGRSRRVGHRDAVGGRRADRRPTPVPRRSRGAAAAPRPMRRRTGPIRSDPGGAR